MALHSFLFYFIILVCTSCQAQQVKQKPNKDSIIVQGTQVSKLSNSIWVIFQASNDDYWFGSDTDGTYRFDGKTLVNFTEKDGLSSNRIRGIQEDQAGNIYFSTLGGINKFDGKSIISLIPIENNDPNAYWKLQKGDLWFSMIGKNGEKGPYRYDGENLYQLIFPKHFLEEDYFKRFPNNAWSPYEVYYIYKDKKEHMWFGTSNFGLCRYDGKTLSWLYEDHLTNVPNGGSFGIRSILEDAKGKYWFCNSRYHYTISPESIEENGNIMMKYQKEKGIEGIQSKDGNHIYFLSIAEDKDGNLWMLTYKDGVWKYDGKKVTHYPVKANGKDITLFSIYKDHKNDLWLGTHENGAYKFNGTFFESFKP